MLLLLYTFFVMSSRSAAQYVKTSSHHDCSFLPCLTLDQYLEQATTYFTDGAVFVFLPGIHHLHTTVNLTNVADAVLMGDRSDDVITFVKEGET